MTSKKRSSWRQVDPFSAREQEKYGRSIPSREFILQTLEERGMPMTLDDLCAEWKLEGDWEVEALSRRLRAMERDGQLIRNRREGYGLVTKMNLVTGRVIGHPEGHGFLAPDEGGDSLFLSPRQMRKLLHGDRAVARVIGVDYRGRREGAVVEVLERNTETVVALKSKLIKAFGDARRAADLRKAEYLPQYHQLHDRLGTLAAGSLNERHVHTNVNKLLNKFAGIEPGQRANAALPQQALLIVGQLVATNQAQGAADHHDGYQRIKTGLTALQGAIALEVASHE